MVIDWHHYRCCRNEVKRKLREAERKYVQREMDNNHSISARWKVIRNRIPSKEKSRPMYSKNMMELANDFNEFFASVDRARTADESKRLALVKNLSPVNLL